MEGSIVGYGSWSPFCAGAVTLRPLHYGRMVLLMAGMEIYQLICGQGNLGTLKLVNET